MNTSKDAYKNVEKMLPAVALSAGLCVPIVAHAKPCSECPTDFTDCTYACASYCGEPGMCYDNCVRDICVTEYQQCIATCC